MRQKPKTDLPDICEGCPKALNATTCPCSQSYQQTYFAVVFEKKDVFLRKNLAEKKSCLPLHPLTETAIQLTAKKTRRHSSAGLEHLPYKQRVRGSNPCASTKKPADFSGLFSFIFSQARSITAKPSICGLVIKPLYKECTRHYHEVPLTIIKYRETGNQ